MEEKRIRRTAILVDGGYYRVRSRDLWGNKSAETRADELYDYCLLHITEPDEPRDLYRIFYYDCPPMIKSLIHPLSGREIDHSASLGAQWSKKFFNTIVQKRKVALRMGELAESTAKYILKDDALDRLLKGKVEVANLQESDFRLDVKQKGVDMRIGLDVASLAEKKLADQIVLIAGDSDFLPVVKMARKSGIDMLLDPLKQFPKRNMQEHIDGLESYTDLVPTKTV